MPRPILDETRMHPAIRQKIANHQQDIVREVQAAVGTHVLVVVGMGQNPQPKKARRLLDEAAIPYHYMEYGNYFNTWRKRNALKLWTGWPTFPMIFVKGMLIGGADDLEKLLADGELRKLMA